MYTNTPGKQNIPEILAPAGTPQALYAAVNAGCDAVYLGGDLFSARAYAGNFSTEEMVNCIEYCHLFGIRVYMTVNTLLKEQEIPLLEPYMRPFYETGLDGVIVQDMGVVRVLSRAFPDLPLHASTQMSITSSYGAAWLKRHGIVRIVPARELSLTEVRGLKETSGMEIEAFVHGAMCYAYSGKCLFSSFLGGRSGNRGRCAQPCRKCYEVFPETLRSRKHPREYIMSLKDMCTLSILPQLIDAGIDSFKIEGRMKNPSYVAATVNAYRTARDYYLQNCLPYASCWEELPQARQQKYQALAADLTRDMMDIYNRGGFHTGYYYTKKGLEMTAVNRPNHAGVRMGTIIKVQNAQVHIRLEEDLQEQDVLEILQTGTELTSNIAAKRGSVAQLKGKDLKRLQPGMEVYRTRNNVLLQKIEQEIILPERQIGARAVIEAREGKPLTITIGPEEGTGPCVTVTGCLVEHAGSRPVSESQLLEKMQKTGGTHVKIRASCHADAQIFVPMSEFNVLRREAVEAYKQAVQHQYHRVTDKTL